MEGFRRAGHIYDTFFTVFTEEFSILLHHNSSKQDKYFIKHMCSSAINCRINGKLAPLWVLITKVWSVQNKCTATYQRFQSMMHSLLGHHFKDFLFFIKFKV